MRSAAVAPSREAVCLVARFRTVSLQVILMMALSFATSATLEAANSAAQNGSTASQQDKINACNSLADKKGLSGNDRKNFMQSCLSQAANAQPPSDMSTKDKMNACKNLADKKNLKATTANHSLRTA